MKKLNIAVAGVGNRAKSGVIPAVLSGDKFTINTLCDVSEENLKAVSGLFERAPVCTGDYTKVLADPDIDGVVVITPNYLHAQMAAAALKAGKPVYLEKPIGISVQDCKVVCDTAKETGVPLMVGMQLRYNNVFNKMKELLTQGYIGALRIINYTQFREPLRDGWDNWRKDKSKSGGSILEVSVHHLDLFHWFSEGAEVKIFALGGGDVIKNETGMLDNILFSLEYDNGVRADIEAILFAKDGNHPRNGMYLFGSGGYMTVKGNSIIVTRMSGETETVAVEAADSTAAALDGFYEYIVNGKKPMITPEDGFRAVAAGLAAERSIETGKAVRLSEIMI